jgi:hypothetical protein
VYLKMSIVLLGILGIALSSCSDLKDGAPSVTIIGSASSIAGLSVRSGAASGSPTSMKIQIYQILVSTSTDCSNPVSLIDHGATPVEVNLVNSPTLVNAAPPSGTYNCLILKMSDVLAYQVDAMAVAAWPGVCANTTTEYRHDIYRTDNGGSVYKDLTGALITATGVKATPSADVVYLMGSTTPADAIAAGYNVNQTFTLLSHLTVPGSSVFYADFSDGIEDTGDGLCTLEEGAGMGFR